MRIVLPLLLLSSLSFGQCNFGLEDLIELIEKNDAQREIYILNQGGTFNPDADWYQCSNGDTFVYGYDENAEVFQIRATTFSKKLYASWLSTAESLETFSIRKVFNDDNNGKTFYYAKYITLDNLLSITLNSSVIDELGWVSSAVITLTLPGVKSKD